MAVGGVGSGPSVLANLFCDANSGPSKWSEAREAGAAAQKKQESAFASQMQGLVNNLSAQMSAGDPSKKYTNAVKNQYRAERALNQIGDAETAKASEASLAALKERMEREAEEARQKKAREADGNGETGTGAANGSVAPDTTVEVDPSGAGGQSVSAPASAPDLPAGGGSAAAPADLPDIASPSAPAPSGGGAGQVHIDVIV